MKQCKECKLQFSDKFKFCPKCGKGLESLSTDVDKVESYNHDEGSVLDNELSETGEERNDELIEDINKESGIDTEGVSSHEHGYDETDDTHEEIAVDNHEQLEITDSEVELTSECIEYHLQRMNESSDLVSDEKNASNTSLQLDDLNSDSIEYHLNRAENNDESALKEDSNSTSIFDDLINYIQLFWENKVLRYLTIAVAVFCIACQTHIICYHDWVKANCTKPEVCLNCGRTRGEPLGHKWLPANCTEPETCERCLETKGLALGHDVGEWETVKEPTCAEVGTKEGICKRCKETIEEDILKLPHTKGEWEIETASTVDKYGDITPGKKVIKCTKCGEILDSKSYELELSVSQKNCMAQAQSYLKSMGFSHKELVHQLEYEGYPHEEAVFAADNCGADWYYQAEREAKSYMDALSFSRSSLIHQLESSGYTHDQAAHGADSVGL